MYFLWQAPEKLGRGFIVAGLGNADFGCLGLE
jgi:hypothetical protein